MRVLVADIKESPTEARFLEDTGELNRLYEAGSVREYRFSQPLEVRASYYRSDKDLFFSGRVDGDVVAVCCRCLEEYRWRMTREFSLVLSPRQALAREVELAADDLGTSFYEGEEIDLDSLVCEQVLLALPTHPLCSDGCKGLCPRCGANRNVEACGCRDEWRDSRLARLATLRVSR